MTIFRTRFTRILKPGLVLLTSTMLALGMSEAVVRRLAPQGVAVPWQDEIDGVRMSRPNVDGRHAIPHTFDVTVSTNAQRFRGRGATDVYPDPATLRVVALGDSFTFGWGADDHNAYPAALERLLQRRFAQSNARVEVLNAGNGGTGTGEQALLFDLYAKTFSPTVVILGVNANDVDDDSDRNLFELRSDGQVYPRPRQQIRAADSRVRLIRSLVNGVPGYSLIAQHSQLFGLLRNQSSRILTQTRKREFADSDAGKNHESVMPSQDGLQIMAGEILWLKSRVEEVNARLVVVFLPPRNVVDPESVSATAGRTGAAAIVETLQDACAWSGIPFADLTQRLRQRWSQTPDLYFAGLDTHPTPAGYEAIAQGVSELLESSGNLALSGVRRASHAPR